MVGIAEDKAGLVGRVAEGLGNTVEVQQARQVKLAAHGAAAVRDVDGRVAGLAWLDLDERDDLLELGKQGVSERSSREARDGLVDGVDRRAHRDLDERHADRANHVVGAL